MILLDVMLPDATVLGPLRIGEPADRVWVDELQSAQTVLVFRLLAAKIKRAGWIQKGDVLLNGGRGIEAVGTTRPVVTHIKRLHHKLSHSGRFIETVCGIGDRRRNAPHEEQA